MLFMKCTKCSNPLSFGAAFCGNCGQQVVFQGPKVEQSAVLLASDPIQDRYPPATFVSTGPRGITKQEMLMPEQIAYISRKSITSFAPGNIIARSLWEIFGLQFGLNVILKISGFWWVDLLVLVGDVLLWSYQLKFARRLAWNRNRWLTFQDFEASERNWFPWGIVGIVLLVLVSFLSALL